MSQGNDHWFFKRISMRDNFDLIIATILKRAYTLLNFSFLFRFDCYVSSSAQHFGAVSDLHQHLKIEKYTAKRKWPKFVKRANFWWIRKKVFHHLWQVFTGKTPQNASSGNFHIAWHIIIQTEWIPLCSGQNFTTLNNYTFR